jgi:hypothetical protein
VPDTKTPAQLEQAEKRGVVATTFIGFLIGLAIATAIEPVRAAVREAGLTRASSFLFLVFMLTTIRFFIGYQLHLMDAKLRAMSGFVWFFDFLVIIVETTILIFMGTLCTVPASSASRYGFFRLMIFLLIADVLWAVVQWVFGIKKSWRREKVLWGWGISGACIIAIMGIVSWATGSLYSDTGLTWMLALNILAFGFDLKLVDVYDLL